MAADRLKPGINRDEIDRPHHALTVFDLNAFAMRCEERAKDGLTFSPSSVPLIVEALRALARERAAR